MENNSYGLKKGDAVTVRGFGKFVYVAEEGETRKGKIRVSVDIYR
jgi:RNA-binding protein YlmH